MNRQDCDTRAMQRLCTNLSGPTQRPEGQEATADVSSQAGDVAFDYSCLADLRCNSRGRILSACNRFNLPLETWRRQERAFGLLKKVYGKRAAIRGQQQPVAVQWP